MASHKRYTDAFEDEEYVDEVACEDVPVEFLNDEGEYCSSSDEEPVVEREVVHDHEAHVANLNEKYARPLEECYEAIKDKLTWASSFYIPVPKESSFPVPAPDRPISRRGRSERVKRFTGKGVPLLLDVRFGGGDPIELAQPQPIIQPRREGLCKFIVAGKSCPFGNECKFNHDLDRFNRNGKFAGNQSRMTTAEGKTKKIWMCKAYVGTGKCRFGGECAYAHSPDEVKTAVSDCNNGTACRKVARRSTEYSNVGDRKCMRLHPRERIANFIARTS